MRAAYDHASNPTWEPTSDGPDVLGVALTRYSSTGSEGLGTMVRVCAQICHAERSKAAAHVSADLVGAAVGWIRRSQLMGGCPGGEQC